MKRYFIIPTCVDRIFLLLGTLFFGILLPASAETLTVTNSDDSGPGSLRDAIAGANWGPDNTTIEFAPHLSGATITLASQLLLETNPAAGNITINGSNLSLPITISGDNATRIFDITGPGEAVLDSIIIANARGSAQGGGISRTGNGSLLIRNSTLENNEAIRSGNLNGVGGGMHLSNAETIIVNCTIRNNFASSNGGGVSFDSGTLRVINTTISANRTGGRGGGIFSGGGGSDLFVRDSTITVNLSGSRGGGISSYIIGTSVTLKNTVIAGNTATVAHPDFDKGNSSLRKQGKNLIGINQGAGFSAPATPGEPNADGDLVGTPANPLDPMLGPLADNGGPTETHAPLPGSPVIDFGDPASLSADGFDLDRDSDTAEPLPVDQRGFPRVSGAGLDLGAVELRASTQGADLLISKNGRNWKGDGMANRTGRGQILTKRIRKNQTARFHSRLQNDGSTASTATLRASTNQSKRGVQRKRWKAKYHQIVTGGQRNISGALKRGYQVNLTPGSEIRILARYRLKLSPRQSLSQSKRTRPFYLVAQSNESTDRTVAKVIRKP